MPSLQTPREILEGLRKGKVVDEKRLDAYLQRANINDMPDEAHEWVNTLVQERVLSNYQALQILQGKWNAFHIGKFRILERLGFGAVSNVYLCEDPDLHDRVAVKVLTKLQAADPASLERFYREARASRLLDHPNIVRAHGVDKDEQAPFMVMDFVDGSSIQDIVEHFGALDPVRCAHYIRQAALGLEYAHQQGLIHRDIKSGNLLIDRQGTLKILDLGMARFAQEEGEVLTQGIVLGAPEYLAPEQAKDSHNVDGRADLYGLGAIFYFMLTAYAPFAEEGSLAKKLTSKQTRDPRPIRALRPEVPEEMVAIVRKMMARNPDERYQKASEVAEALTPWTQKPLAPPLDQEMPKLSPVARGEPMLAPPEPAPKAGAKLIVNKTPGTVHLSKAALAKRQSEADPPLRKPPETMTDDAAVFAGRKLPPKPSLRQTLAEGNEQKGLSPAVKVLGLVVGCVVAGIVVWFLFFQGK